MYLKYLKLGTNQVQKVVPLNQFQSDPIFYFFFKDVQFRLQNTINQTSTTCYCKSYCKSNSGTFLLPVIQLMISNTFLVRLMQQLFLSKHLIIKFYILCVISVKCIVWILKWLLNPMISLIIVSESTIECSSIILFVMVGRYTFYNMSTFWVIQILININ